MMWGTTVLVVRQLARRTADINRNCAADSRCHDVIFCYYILVQFLVQVRSTVWYNFGTLESLLYMYANYQRIHLCPRVKDPKYQQNRTVCSSQTHAIQ